MIDPLRNLPVRRKVELSVWVVNIVVCAALLCFPLR